MQVNFTPGNGYKLNHPSGNIVVCRWVTEDRVSFWVSSGSSFWATESEPRENFELIGENNESGFTMIRRVR